MIYFFIWVVYHYQLLFHTIRSSNSSHGKTSCSDQQLLGNEKTLDVAVFPIPKIKIKKAHNYILQVPSAYLETDAEGKSGFPGSEAMNLSGGLLINLSSTKSQLLNVEPVGDI